MKQANEIQLHKRQLRFSKTLAKKKSLSTTNKKYDKDNLAPW